jgi:hypothetical protein
MNDDFSRVLSQRMDYYSNDPNADNINRMRGEIDQVRVVPYLSSICHQIILMALDRHIAIDMRAMHACMRHSLFTVLLSSPLLSSPLLLPQVRSVMLDNIDRVLERGDRLELLVDKTAAMEGNTMRFKRQARRFRNTVWWRNVKLTYVVADQWCTFLGPVFTPLFYLEVISTHLTDARSVCVCVYMISFAERR